MATAARLSVGMPAHGAAPPCRREQRLLGVATAADWAGRILLGLREVLKGLDAAGVEDMRTAEQHPGPCALALGHEPEANRTLGHRAGHRHIANGCPVDPLRPAKKNNVLNFRIIQNLIPI